jgi:hypothetical protein
MTEMFGKTGGFGTRAYRPAVSERRWTGRETRPYILDLTTLIRGRGAQHAPSILSLSALDWKNQLVIVVFALNRLGVVFGDA